ncbi:hypothetical protein [Dyella sp. 2RAB6]|uniref:hypothetical protein n=1 Tax=Dyella sp. 2RAB6 TaxID=3232992 RepID=UPI003F8E5B89
MRRMSWCLMLALCLSWTLATAAEAPPFEPAQAKAWFGEMQRQCQADGGKLWGASLCGPIMLVEPSSRRVIANQADTQGLLQAEQGVFTGHLPDDVSFANSSLDWAGVRWAQMGWPLPADAGQRRVLMAHESFHRIQPQVGLEPPRELTNDHLDSLQGRYLMQLEWRALAKAVAATDHKTRRSHAEDALLFRAARYRQFPAAAQSERSLERNEGLAEYTGIAIGAISPAERTALTAGDLVSHVSAPSFVRSFAYATGPGYGLLLDRYLPAWRQRIKTPDTGLSDLLASALGTKNANPTDADVQRRAAAYDGPALLATEQAREQRHQQDIARYKALLVDGPRLVLPLHEPKVMFNPSTLVPLGEAGTVYPTIKVLSDWGAIEVSAGALLAPDWKHLYVAVPDPQAARKGSIAGPGWTLKLNDGWRIDAGERPGDMVLSPPNQGAH